MYLEKINGPDRKFISVPYEPADQEIVPLLSPAATYTEIKDWIRENYNGMNVSSLYVAQIKTKLGLEKRENYNKPKNPNAKVPVCPPEKEKAIMAALKHFKMI